MMPAAELRTAAKTLRCDHRFPVEPPQGVIGRPGDCTGCGVPYGGDPVPDALAEPLAALLEDATALLAEHPDLARDHVDGEPCTDLACRIVTSARAVARVIRGPQ